ncbi:MAG: hypothetical protein ACLGIR_10585 [Actinomycetes bacterium]
MDEATGRVTGPSILASVWRHRYAVAAVVATATALGYAASSQQDETYEATARLFLSDPRQSTVFTRASVDPERYVPQQAERVESSPVLERLVELTDEVDSTAEARRQLSVEGDVELDLILVTGSAGTPEAAADIANAAAEAYTTVTSEVKTAAAEAAATELQAAIDELDAQIAALGRRAGGLAPDTLAAEQLDVLVQQRVELAARSQQLLVDARVFGSGVDYVEPATPPADPSAPSPTRDGVLAGLLAGALAAAGAYWRAGRDPRVEGRNQPGELLGLPLLGVIPVYPRTGGSLADRLSIDASAQEAYDFLLSSVIQRAAGAGARTILVTSPQPGDGKTEVSLQLTVSAMLQGRRALLVDGDLRVRATTRLVGLDGGPGLVDLAVTESRVVRSYVGTVPILDGQLQLPVLPAGSTAAEGSGSLRSPRVTEGLNALASDLDLVVIDAAPLLATADTTVLSGHVDAILLVLREGTSLGVIEAMKERLAFVGAPVLGYAYISSSEVDVPYAYGYGGYRYQGARGQRAEVVGIDDTQEAPVAVAAPTPAPAPAPDPVPVWSTAAAQPTAAAGSTDLDLDLDVDDDDVEGPPDDADRTS